MERALRVEHASKGTVGRDQPTSDTRAHVMLVTDGHSGRGARDASRAATHAALDGILNALSWTPDFDVDSEAELRRELKNILSRCDTTIQATGPDEPHDGAQSTAMTLAFVRWPLAFLVHAGDSRAYLIREQRTTRLTTDHTVAQKLVSAGQLNADRVETSRFARVMWNAVGGSTAVEPELEVRRLESNDALLLCSKGLTQRLSERAIARVVDETSSAREATDELVRLVADLPGHDDVTATMLRVMQDDTMVPAVPYRTPLQPLRERARTRKSRDRAVDDSVDEPRNRSERRRYQSTGT